MCHADVHRGVIGRGEVLQAVARRLRKSVAEVEKAVQDLLEAKK